MRTGPISFQTPTATGGINGSRYTFENISQNPTYAQVMRHFHQLSGTYEEGARKSLPSAIEAAETVFTPEQTAQLCDDTFTHIGITAFQAFERYPAIFSAAQKRLDPDDLLSILEKLTKQGRSSLPFNCLAKTIEGMEGLSSEQIADLIISSINPHVIPTCNGQGYVDASSTYRALDLLAPAFQSARTRFGSAEEAIEFVKLARSNFIGESDQIIKAIPGLISGVSSSYSREQIVAAFKTSKIPDLSDAGNAIVALYKVLLLRQDDFDHDAKVQELVAQLKIEGEKARASNLPTIGGKIGGRSKYFDMRLLTYLEMLGFEYRSEIIRGEQNVCDNCMRDLMIKLPPGRSAFETSILIDMLLDVGVFADGAVLRHQITVEGRLLEEAKYIALALHSAQPIPVPYPRAISGDAVGIKYLAPVVEGGWILEDINDKGAWTKRRVELPVPFFRIGFDVPVPRLKFRFDLPLLSVYVLMDEYSVLEKALGRAGDDLSLLETMLVGVYRMFDQEWRVQPPRGEPASAMDDVELLEVESPNGTFLREQADVQEYYDALEAVYGEDFINVRANHNFTIHATQFLSWAMQSPYSSQQNRVFREFKVRMHKLYREAGIESTLKTRWKRRRWEQIYPSLSQLDAIKDPEFHEAVRVLVIETIHKLQGLV